MGAFMLFSPKPQITSFYLYFSTYLLSEIKFDSMMVFYAVKKRMS